VINRTINFATNINRLHNGQTVSIPLPELQIGRWYVSVSVPSMNIVSQPSDEFTMGITLINTNISLNTSKELTGIHLSNSGDILAACERDSGLLKLFGNYLYTNYGTIIDNSSNDLIVPVRSISLSSDTNRLAVLEEGSRTVKFFDYDSDGRYIYTRNSTIPSSSIPNIIDISLNNSGTGNKIAVLKSDGYVHICHRNAEYYVGNDNTIDVINTGISVPLNVSINEDGTMVAVSNNNSVKIYRKNASTGTFNLAHNITGVDIVPTSISMNAVGSFLTVISGTFIKMYETTNYELIYTMETFMNEPKSVSVSGDGTYLALCGIEYQNSPNYIIKVYNITV
jgi:hypothetical protein